MPTGTDPRTVQERFRWRLDRGDEKERDKRNWLGLIKAQPQRDISWWSIEMRIERLAAAVARATDLDKRIAIADRLILRADEAWVGHVSAGHKRERSQSGRTKVGWLKAMAAATAAPLAATSGVALLANAKGWLTSVLGLIAVVLGGLAAALNAVDTEAEVQRNRYKSREYERLWRDIWDYLLLGLPSDTIPQARGQLTEFSGRYSEIGLHAQDLGSATRPRSRTTADRARTEA